MKKVFQFSGIVFIIILAICSCSSTGSQDNQNEAKSIKKDKIEILSQNVTDTDFGITVVSEIKNNTKKTATYVELKSVFTDENDIIIGTGVGNTMNLEPGQIKTIEVISIESAENVTKFKVEVAEIYWE